mmetsp:Transcript_11921/g.17418  ORF Transcript_11921/g.17418 Transcript_11921/m.17418 type:complete len:742 (+) Transcript_11921:241-2466(+)|eukprot:CAMPEP_0202425440 /NCGR_PEP_ID=MMETSP1345-20130828/102_1 /ASSEMBLY_ACC=CAM_ASM_000843 /TAXON_ID=342563 /ORGANISM="Fabrea Fabrea salina" /LENGTH=741 /DNA_ID=CAMNT_0049035675 /DNA_START=227 /DNA_END=2452 /DNA_ORIENTATION=+
MKIGKSDVSFGFVVPSSGKILSVDVHPVHSWILLAEEPRSVNIWDYQSKSVLQTFTQHVDDNPKEVRFLDRHVLRWKWINRDVDCNTEAFQGKGTRRNLVSVLMDSKVCLFDYISGETKTILAQETEAKQLTCLEYLDGSYLALGTSDGGIRLWDIEAWELTRVIPKGTHTRSVTKLLSFSKNLRQRPVLLSAGADGVIAVWNLDTPSDIPAYLVPSGGVAAHNSAILSVSLHTETMQLVTVGQDKFMMVWNLMNANEVARYRNLKDSSKKPVVGACYFQHCLFGESTVLAHCRTSQVLAIDTAMASLPKEHRQFKCLIDLNLALNGSFQILDLKVHPVRPYLVFVVTAGGVYTMYFEKRILPSCAYSNLFTCNIPPRAMKERVASNFLYLYKDDMLQSMIFAVDSQDTVASQVCRLASASQSLGQGVQIKVSPSGHYISLFSPKTGFFEILCIFLENYNPLQPPQKVKSGYASNLVWHSEYDRFAVVSPINEDDTGGSFTNITSKVLLLVYEMNKSKKASLVYRGDTIVDPYGILGGRLLGVTPEKGGNTALYNWENMQQVAEIPEPVEIYWGPEFAVFAYKNEFYLYAVEQTLVYMCKINHSVKSGVWCKSVFFYSTETEIWWMLAALRRPYLLASHGIDISEELDLQSSATLIEDSEVTYVQRKPFEICSVVGVFSGYLCVMNSNYRLEALPLKGSFLRFCMLADAGAVEKALEYANQLHPSLKPLVHSCLFSLGIQV